METNPVPQAEMVEPRDRLAHILMQDQGALEYVCELLLELQESGLARERKQTDQALCGFVAFKLRGR